MRRSNIGIILLAHFLAACAVTPSPPTSPRGQPLITWPTHISVPTNAVPFWIDTHTHLTGSVVVSGTAGQQVCSTHECLDRIIAALDEFEIQKALLMHPPAPAGAGAMESEMQIAGAAKKHSSRFAFAGGGAVLNSAIQQAAKGGGVPSDAGRTFRNNTQALIDAGALAFGETTALHLSASATHAFEESPADNVMFLLLANLAAQHGVPIDIHLEAVVSEMATPKEFQQRSPLNPKTLRANITGFERLLEHNRNARIVWAHVGWDHTGDMTVDLVRRLLEKHRNLYIQLRIARGRVAEHSIMDERGSIRTEWLNALRVFPDRFVVGSDTFLGAQVIDRQNLASHRAFIMQLPSDLASKVACENANTIYRLKVACGN